MNARHAGPDSDDDVSRDHEPARRPAAPGSRRARRAALEAEQARAAGVAPPSVDASGGSARSRANERSAPAESVLPAAVHTPVGARSGTGSSYDHAIADAQAGSRGMIEDPVFVGAGHRAGRDTSGAPAEAAASGAASTGSTTTGSTVTGSHRIVPPVEGPPTHRAAPVPDAPHSWQAPSRPRFGAPARRPDDDADTGAASAGVGFRPVDPSHRTAPAPSIWDVMSGTRHSASAVCRRNEQPTEVDGGGQWAAAEVVWPTTRATDGEQRPDPVAEDIHGVAERDDGAIADPSVQAAAGADGSLDAASSAGTWNDTAPIDVPPVDASPFRAAANAAAWPDVTPRDTDPSDTVSTDAASVDGASAETGPTHAPSTGPGRGTKPPGSGLTPDSAPFDTAPITTVPTDAGGGDTARAAAPSAAGTEPPERGAASGGPRSATEEAWADRSSRGSDTAPIAVDRGGVAVVGPTPGASNEPSGSSAFTVGGARRSAVLAAEPPAIEPSHTEPLAAEATVAETIPAEPIVAEPRPTEVAGRPLGEAVTVTPASVGSDLVPSPGEPAGEATSDADVGTPVDVRADERLAAAIVRLGVAHVVSNGEDWAVTAQALASRGVSVTPIELPGAAVAAADIATRVSGRLGVVLLGDPAAAASSIAEAVGAGSGLVLLVRGGDSPRQVDADLPHAVGATTLIHDPERAIDDDLERALHAAALGARPVLLRVPVADTPPRGDDAPHGPARRSFVGRPTDARRVRPAPSQLERLQSALLGADRPVFVAGRGAAEAAGAIAALAEECGALLATGDANVGLFREAGARGGADIGSVGDDATPVARELLAGTDLVVAWGSSGVDDASPLVRIDIEPSALRGLGSGQVGVVGDCALVAIDALQALQRERLLREAAEAGPRRAGRRAAPAGESTVELEVAALLAADERTVFEELDPLPPLTDAPPAPLRARSSFTPATARRASDPEPDTANVVPPRIGYRSHDVLARIAEQRDWRDVPFEDASGASGTGWRIDPRRLVAAVDDVLPDERVVVVGADGRSRSAARRLVVRDAAGYVPAVSLPGLALASAIGAARSAPALLPVLVTDDAGLRGGLADLGAAVGLRIPLVVLVLDASPAGSADLAAVAGALGAQDMRVRGPGDLGAVARQVSERVPGEPGRPLVIVANVVVALERA